MDDLTRRDALKLTVAAGALAALPAASVAQDSAASQDRAADESRRHTQVYGNQPRWDYFMGHWYYILDRDRRYQPDDARGVCGDSTEYWTLVSNIKSRQRLGSCPQLPGRPAKWLVKFKTPVDLAQMFTRGAQAFSVDKNEDMQGPEDTTQPSFPNVEKQ